MGGAMRVAESPPRYGNAKPLSDVPPGYKRTEVGVIPEDWELATFEKVFQFLPTATNSRSDLSLNGDIYYLHYGDIHTKYDYILDLSKNTLPKINNLPPPPKF